MESSTASQQRPAEAVGARSPEGGAASASPEARRARFVRKTVQAEGTILAVSVLVLVLSSVMTPSDSVLTLFGWEVPPLCVWKNLTGLDCPGCGLTRSFTWMGHGDVVAAFARHRLGPLLYLGVALQVPLRVRRIVRTLRGDGPAGRPPARG